MMPKAEVRVTARKRGERKSMKVVYKAPSMIERDALVTYLRENGLLVETPQLDLRRKITETTVDLAYEGYSAMAGDFPIYVPESDLEHARKLIDRFLEAVRERGKGPVAAHLNRSFQKFYLSSFACLILPGLMHCLALYNLYFALKNKEKSRPLLVLASTLVFFASLPLLWLIVERLTKGLFE